MTFLWGPGDDDIDFDVEEIVPLVTLMGEAR